MTTHRAITLFAAASLLPAACLVAAAVWAGPWPLISLLCMTLFVLSMDRLGPWFEADVALVSWLPWTVAAAHFVSLYAVLWSLGQNTALDSGAKILLVIAMGLYTGQVSNSCAHELIHRPDRASRWLGTAVYCSILNGHHVSAHLLVHHVHAGTRQDPTSAPLGRGYYRFAMRAAGAEFAAGWRAETRRRAVRARGMHPYAVYGMGAVLSLSIAVAFGGPIALLGLLIISAHALMQLLLSDYVQHYGLHRRLRTDGKPEPMGPEHSWNAPQPYSAAMMMNAPRHSDHHMNPLRPFAQLELSPTAMPTLPHSLPVMGAVALIPPLWRHMMDPRARTWATRSQDCPRPASTSATSSLTAR